YSVRNRIALIGKYLRRFTNHVYFRRPGKYRCTHSFPTRRSSDLGSRGSSDSCQHRFVQEDTAADAQRSRWALAFCPQFFLHRQADRKSTRLNSSHVKISYAVFCLKKKILM